MGRAKTNETGTLYLLKSTELDIDRHKRLHVGRSDCVEFPLFALNTPIGPIALVFTYNDDIIEVSVCK